MVGHMQCNFGGAQVITKAFIVDWTHSTHSLWTVGQSRLASGLSNSILKIYRGLSLP